MTLRDTLRGKIRRGFVKLRHRVAPPGSGPVHVFHHIPKTGGATVNRAIPNWFYLVRDYRDRRDPDDWTAGHVPTSPMDLDQLRYGDCLSGHWALEGTYLHERYPEILDDSRFRLFTFVRDPLELRLSLLWWEKRQGKDFSELNFRSEFLGRQNFMARRFPCDEENYRSVLSRYFFIGITGRLQESMDLLANHLGKARVSLGRANRSRRGDESALVDDELIQEFRARNRLDQAIYDHCVERFEAHDGLRSRSA